MRLYFNPSLIFATLLLLCQCCFSQEQPGGDKIDKAIQFPDRLFGKLDTRAVSFNKQLDKQTERYLARIKKQEAKLRKKITAKDSNLAKQLFDGVQDKYLQLQKAPAAIGKYASVYSGGLDSVTSSLNFIKNNNINNLADNPELQKALGSYAALQSKLNASEQLSKYLAQRRQLLQQHLQQLGMMKELNQFKRQTAFYQSQVQEYKNMLNEPSKVESALLALAQKIPAWKNFFAGNSLLGSMFALPTSGGNTPAIVLPGLQSRVMVNQALTNQLGSMNAVTQALQQNVPAAQKQLQLLKDKLNKYSNGSYGNGDASSAMPDYSVNPQHSKSFWKRLTIGTTIQSQKANGILPVTTDLGLSFGFKLSDKKTIGVGISEKIGWGNGWRHINLTQAGMGIKSFLDIKLIKSIWITGGYELNWLPGLRALDSLAAAHHLVVGQWSKSGLLGLSKQMSLKGKTAKVQLLWDFLSYSQQVKTPAIIWRLEYGIK